LEIQVCYNQLYRVGGIPKNQTGENNMKLGAYYWDGWYAKIPHWTPRLLSDFADREPVWGWLGDTVENMNMQINYAADAGLSFFAFDWYYPEHGHINRMNEAVDRFLAAKDHTKMQFCLLVANHSGGFIFRDKWEDACRRFMPYLTHPQALKYDGKPIIIFFSSGDLVRCLGGVEEAKKCHDYLNDLLIKEGYPGVYVIGCVNPCREADGGVDTNPESWENTWCGFGEGWLDGITGYNYHRGSLKRAEEITGGDEDYIYPYNSLAADHEVSCDLFLEHSSLPYMPLAIGGWDCRPWEVVWEGGTTAQSRSCYSPDRTPADIYRHIMKIGEKIRNNPGKTISDYSIIYAWNENGEGGYIEPTYGDRGSILNAVGKAIKDTNTK